MKKINERMKENLWLLLIVLIIGAFSLTSQGCVGKNGETGLTKEQKLAAESIVVRAGVRQACYRHPEAIPVFQEICAEAEGKEGAALATLIRVKIAEYAEDIGGDPLLKEDIDDLVTLLGLPEDLSTLPEVSSVIDNEKLEKLFGAACQGVAQATPLKAGSGN